ncbi:P-loop containing nucleoside triphosphate hydrolase protein [Boeremia exigua]|uniref:P-loop containing nucleoside triphosphate hydrolase protein n=1 Tax=Boeremia exigua TaxID=749465 RepID=UPI001E8DDD03|nr:P-loop containing nucleoside triphosphate hydrolase protein [Boeremia exigua]KAH6613021.1 P-loop containing nucleoside triphosphate hydrolase protein [Boeremia exigua]
MVLIALDNDILNQLCSEDQLELLDAVDGLRSQGIDSYISLPQIIVCGDQSAGKSSVLEAISGVSFPIKSNLCTRFLTELVLRNRSEITVSIWIRLDTFNELPDLIKKAKAAMAISTVGRISSKDLLRIEVSGPDRPQLTIVDLPGLMHSETNQQSIILAIVSAKNDYANQIVLELARNYDKNGERTLGVITKPDTSVSGSPTERTFVSLTRNQDVVFCLGWHVLRNLDLDTGKWSSFTRDTKEKEFFLEGIWRTMPNSILGIGTLRKQLSRLLPAQIATELPSLAAEINTKFNLCQDELKRLGKPRTTAEEQLMYLLRVSERCQSLTKAAVDGYYNDPFLKDPRSDIGYQKRLRAVIQKLNITFANTMERRGHRYNITDDSPKKAADAKTTTISRAEFMDHIEHLIERTRGRDLPGTYNPLIVTALFEQSQPWEIIVQQHLREVSQAVKNFLRLFVSYIADGTTSKPLFQTVFEPSLHSLEEDLKKKITGLLAAHQHEHPITYNPVFTKIVDGVCSVKMKPGFASIIKDFFQITSLDSGQYHEVSDFSGLLKALKEYTQPMLARPACSKALDCMEVYYKIALQRFVDDISVEAVESNMMSKLHGILWPSSRILRTELENKLEVLTIGAQICTRIISIGLRAASALSPTSTMNSGEDVVFVEAYNFETKESPSSINDCILS